MLKNLYGLIRYHWIRRMRKVFPQSRGNIRFFLEYKFRKNMGIEIDLDNPKTFNEKIEWLKFNYHNPLLTKCADKVMAREYIKDTVGEKYLVESLGAWDSADDIDFDALPEQFVLKVNHGCKQNIIHRSGPVDVKKYRRKLNMWLSPNRNHYFQSFEWQYKNIKPKILGETYVKEMDDSTGEYEFFCLSGNPEFILLRDYARGRRNLNYLDKDYKKMPFYRRYKNSDNIPPKPKELKEMLSICKKLAKPFPLVRINIIKTSDGLKVNELTFTPGNGYDAFVPNKYDLYFGKMIKLPKPIIEK